jgi:hypothetical protein
VERLGGGELLIAIGAALIVLISWLLTGVILYEFFPQPIIVAAALAILVLLYLERWGGRDLGATYLRLLLLLGTFVALVVGIEFVNTIRNLGSRNLADWVGLLSYWGGAILIGIGTFMEWRDSRTG